MVYIFEFFTVIVVDLLSHWRTKVYYKVLSCFCVFHLGSIILPLPYLEWFWPIIVVLDTQVEVLERKISGEKRDTLISFLFTRVLLGSDDYHFS